MLRRKKETDNTNTIVTSLSTNNRKNCNVEYKGFKIAGTYTPIYIYRGMRVAWLCFQTQPSRFNHRTRANRGQDIFKTMKEARGSWIGAGTRVGGQAPSRSRLTSIMMEVAFEAVAKTAPVRDTNSCRLHYG